MPYCPKCDMEFVKGITVCSDCGGLLAESREAAKAVQKEEKRLKQEALKAELDASKEDDNSWGTTDPGATPVDQIEKLGRSRTGTYVKKAQKYEDLKSSAAAFVLVGGAMLIFAVLCWVGIIPIPMTGFSKLMFQTVLTVMGIASLVVAITSSRSAKGMSSLIAKEEQETADIIAWFSATYTGATLDAQLFEEFPDIGADEQNLKRFELIQDKLVTQYDLPDQAYVDSLCEDIYAKLYEE